MDLLFHHDYSHGQLPELIDVIIEERVPLFVSAIGVPACIVDKLHKAGILVMNVSGSTFGLPIKSYSL
jgi:hypothetical protein